MSSLTPITIGDGTADRVFKPRDTVAGLSTLTQGTGVPIGDNRLTIQNTRTPTGKSKVAMKFVLPVVQDVVVSGISRPTVVRTAYANVELTFDATSNPAERASARTLLQNLLGSTVGADVVDQLNPLY
jgi:hypothetical protein